VIGVETAIAFEAPISLSELRRRHRRFVAPQSFRFVSPAEVGWLLNGEAQELRQL
jgi:hypothetical protein